MDLEEAAFEAGFDLDRSVAFEEAAFEAGFDFHRSVAPVLDEAIFIASHPAHQEETVAVAIDDIQQAFDALPNRSLKNSKMLLVVSQQPPKTVVS